MVPNTARKWTRIKDLYHERQRQKRKSEIPTSPTTCKPDFAPGLPQRLHCLGEQTTVHGIDYRLGADLATAEEPPIESLDGVLAALHFVELEVDVAGGVCI